MNEDKPTNFEDFLQTLYATLEPSEILELRKLKVLTEEMSKEDLQQHCVYTFYNSLILLRQAKSLMLEKILRDPIYDPSQSGSNEVDVWFTLL
jgi:hypothetical protein